MNKKILIGSIITVAVLIGVSFTSVVGNRSFDSNVKASPLFGIRTRRAIGQGQQDIITDYLGYGEETNIHITSRIKKAEQVQKAINIINKMDDRAFSKFVARIINQEKMNGKELLDVIQTFQHIRRNPNDINYNNTKNNLDTVIGCLYTLEYLTCWGFPGCLYYQITEILFRILLIFLNPIFDKITSLFNCVSGNMWCTEYNPCEFI